MIMTGVLESPEGMRRWCAQLEAKLRALSSVSSQMPMANNLGGLPVASSSAWRGEVVQVQRSAPGLVSGRVNLQGWASSAGKLQGKPNAQLIQKCVVTMVNGALGQRGQLMNEIPAEAVAIRLNGFSAEFCLWLPSLSQSSTHCNSEADVFYASMVAHALSRLSYGEANDYFPLFVLARNSVASVRDMPLATMPLSAPAPVPRSATLPADTIAAKDACEMMLCSTKQRKRKGVPYCGTCRKFMEETVKWYYDLFKTHPAKEKDKFVEAVRGQRYNCKQDRTEGMPCGCKACHSLRRFQEMYPKCKANLHEFKRRSYLFVEPTTTTATMWSDPEPKAVKTEKSSLLPVMGLDANLRAQTEAAKGKRRRSNSFGQILGSAATHQPPPHLSSAHASAGGLTPGHDQRGAHSANAPQAATPTSQQLINFAGVQPANIGMKQRAATGMHSHGAPMSSMHAHDTGLEYTGQHQHQEQQVRAADVSSGRRRTMSTHSEPGFLESDFPDVLMNELLDPNMVKTLTGKGDPPKALSPAQAAEPWNCPLCAVWNHPTHSLCARCSYFRMQAFG